MCLQRLKDEGKLSLFTSREFRSTLRGNFIELPRNFQSSREWNRILGIAQCNCFFSHRCSAYANPVDWNAVCKDAAVKARILTHIRVHMFRIIDRKINGASAVGVACFYRLKERNLISAWRFMTLRKLSHSRCSTEVVEFGGRKFRGFKDLSI